MQHFAKAFSRRQNVTNSIKSQQLIQFTGCNILCFSGDFFTIFKNEICLQYEKVHDVETFHYLHH